MAKWNTIFKANNDVAEISRRDLGSFKHIVIVYNEERAKLSDEMKSAESRLESARIALEAIASGKKVEKSAEDYSTEIEAVKAEIADIETRKEAISKLWSAARKEAVSLIPGAMFDNYEKGNSAELKKEIRAWLVSLGFCENVKSVPVNAVNYFAQIDRAKKLSAGKFCEVNNKVDFKNIKTVKGLNRSGYNEAILMLFCDKDGAGSYLPGEKRCTYITQKMRDAVAKAEAKKAKSEK